MILQKIVGERKRQVEALKQALPLEEIIRLLEEPNELQRSMRRTGRDLKQAVRQALGLGIIAEVKQASPSKGIIRRDFEPLATAREYEIYGAVGISVLTEPKYFLGRDEYLVEIAAAVSIPVLRKDFIVDQYQIYQSKLLGADCILLIAAVLDDNELAGFLRVAQELGLQCLVEVHCKEELERVLQADAGFIDQQPRPHYLRDGSPDHSGTGPTDPKRCCGGQRKRDPHQRRHETIGRSRCGWRVDRRELNAGSVHRS